MRDYRRQDGETPRRHAREWPERSVDEVREYRRDDSRWSAHNPEDWGEQHLTSEGYPTAWGPRERGGYWRRYEAARPQYAGRGPKGYKRSDDRIHHEICDRMTDDPELDASEI